MLVRCERCRTIYQYEPAPTESAAAVQCARCLHQFIATPALLLDIAGTLGGAAALAPVDVARVSTVRPRQSRSLSPWLIVGLSLVVALTTVATAAVVNRYKLRHTTEPLPAAAVRAEGGESLLWRDDSASLQAAITTFSEAQSLDPANPAYVAQRALATLLLGLSRRAEAEDLMRALDESSATKEASLATVDLERVNGLKRKIVEATGQAESLVKDGLALEAQAEERAAGRTSMAVVRTALLADSILGRLRIGVMVDVPWPAQPPAAPSMEAWRAFCAGVARISHQPSGLDWAAAQSEFEMAAKLSPRFLRARWSLARASLALPTPDLTRARAALDFVIQVNPAHDDAARELSALTAVAATSTP